MKNKKFILILLITAILFTVFMISTASADITEYNIKYEKGYYFQDPFSGAEATGIFNGSLPAAFTVKENGSFIVAESKLIFRDYVFTGWRYSYKNDEDKTVSKIYQPGDVITNVSKNMTFSAVWKRFGPVEMVIQGFLSFKSDEPYYEGELNPPIEVIYNNIISLPRHNITMDGHDFKGWVDSDGEFYENGGPYTVNKYNPVLKAVWTVKGNVFLTHSITYENGSAEAAGEPPKAHNLYEKNTFTAADNTFERQNYRFLYWTDTSGNKYYPGEVYQADSEVTILTAVWEYSAKYYTVEIIQNEGGTVSASSKKIAENDSLELYITPNDGYKIKEITLNGVHHDTKNSLNIESVTENIVLKVEFTEFDKYYITFEKAQGGSVIITDGRDFVFENESIYGSIIAEEGYYFVSLAANGVEISTESNSFVYENPKEDVVFTAVFKKTEINSGIVSSPESGENPKEGNKIYIVFLAVIIAFLVGGGIFFFKKR